ncbi:hypothetical protein GN956_G6689 [Arapaima gigas]
MSVAKTSPMQKRHSFGCNSMKKHSLSIWESDPCPVPPPGLLMPCPISMRHAQSVITSLELKCGFSVVAHIKLMTGHSIQRGWEKHP